MTVMRGPLFGGGGNSKVLKRSSQLVPGDLVTKSSIQEFVLSTRGLSPEKVTAISELGLASLLDIGCTTQVGPVWRLMVHNIDLSNHTVSIHGHNFPVNALEFSRIMGVIDGGAEIELGATTDAGEYGVFVQDLCDREGRIQVYLLKEIVINRAAVDDTFRIAFTMLAMALVLCPGTGEDVDPSFVLPLLDTGKIRNKNWVSFCVKTLLEAVTAQRESGDGVIGGCVLFLQTLYFDKVGDSMFHVDRSVLPVTGWGDFEVRELISRIRCLGGFKSPIVLMERSKRSKMATKCDVDDGEFGLGLRKGVHEDIFDIKLDMMGVKGDISRLTGIVGRLQPDMADLTGKVDIIARELRSWKKEVAHMVRYETRQVLSERWDTCNLRSVPVWTPPRNDVRKNGKSVRDAAIQVEENMGTRTMNAKQVSQSDVGEAVRAVLATSSSPGEPPSMQFRRSKAVGAGASRAVASPYARALFTYAVPENERLESGHCAEYAVGPYLLQKAVCNEDLLLINYIFIGGRKCTVEEGRTIVAACGNKRALLYRDEISCLGPDKFVTSFVINFAADGLNTPESTDWFLPTYFSEKANTYDAGESPFRDWVEHTRTLCNLDRFNGLLEKCKRIFLPMHDEKNEGHWFLMVVDMHKKVAEIWDSLPSFFGDSRRWEIAIRTLRHLDHCFYFEKMRLKGSTDFGMFDHVVLDNVPTQKNGVDCGVFVIQNMMHFKTKWNEGATSHQLRCNVLLRCLKSPANERAKFTLREARGFAEADGLGRSLKDPNDILGSVGWDAIDLAELEEVGAGLGVGEDGLQSLAGGKDYVTFKGNNDLTNGFPTELFRQ